MIESATLLRAVLGLLAAYHLTMGAVAVSAPDIASRLAGLLYGTSTSASPQLRYGLRMLGLYALALGILLALAFSSPREHREVILVAAGLQVARAICRVVFRAELSAGFGVPPSRNALNVSLLVAEACVLAVAFPVSAR